MVDDEDKEKDESNSISDEERSNFNHLERRESNKNIQINKLHTFK